MQMDSFICQNELIDFTPRTAVQKAQQANNIRVTMTTAIYIVLSRTNWDPTKKKKTSEKSNNVIDLNRSVVESRSKPR